MNIVVKNKIKKLEALIKEVEDLYTNNNDPNLFRLLIKIKYNKKRLGNSRNYLEPITFEDIGDILGVTKQGAKYIEEKAINKIKKIMGDQKDEIHVC